MTDEQRQVTFAHSRFRGTREQLVNALNAMPIRGGISGQVVAEAAAAELASNAARIDLLEGFIRDFAACKFDALPHPFTADPQDRPDDVTDHAAVMAWQDDARDLLKGGE